MRNLSLDYMLKIYFTAVEKAPARYFHLVPSKLRAIREPVGATCGWLNGWLAGHEVETSIIPDFING